MYKSNKYDIKARHFVASVIMSSYSSSSSEPSLVIIALEIAQLTGVIERLDLGLDTLVGKDGIKLSGGQRQRV